VKADIYKTPTYYNEGPRKLSILHTIVTKGGGAYHGTVVYFVIFRCCFFPWYKGSLRNNSFNRSFLYMRTSERCYRTRRGWTDEQRYAIISPYFDGRIKMNGTYPEITNISFLAKLFFKTFISLIKARLLICMAD
jgi:hypothetical protein